MAVKRGGLGRGLGSVISENKITKNEEKAVATETTGTGESLISLSLIDPNRFQPRQHFKKEALEELCESIKIHGVIEPLILQKKSDNRYEIIAGERRFRAAKLAKLKEVPAIIKEYEDKERFEIALIENIQREDLNSIEEAQAYQRLIEEYGLRQEELALRVSKSRVAITNSMRLLKLDARVQQMVVDDMISGGHARALLSIEDGDMQYELAGRVYEERLSVRDIEKIVRSMANAGNKTTKEKQKLEDEAIYNGYAKNLIALTGSKVEIQRKSNNKGKIVIDFNSADEFEKIYEIILKGGKE